MSHNKQLSLFLNEIETIVSGATKEEDFKKLFEKLEHFEKTVGPIAYSHKAKYYTLGILALCAAVLGLLFAFVPSFEALVSEYVLFIGAGFAIAALIPVCMMLANSARIGSISENIFEKDIYFDNKLTPINIKGRKTKLYKEWREIFGEFRDRGDESRSIERMVRGTYASNELGLIYDYYVFRYVRVYYVPVTKKVGNTTITTMERRMQTLYRYGIMTDFPYAAGIAVVSSGGSYTYPEEWETTSSEFNGTFAVYTQTEMGAAQFLKPTVILAFTELARYFSGLNIEIAENGKMNIAFEDDNLIELERRHSIASPAEFEKEIFSHLTLPKLDKLMQFIETLKRFNDNNFEDAAETVTRPSKSAERAPTEGATA